MFPGYICLNLPKEIQLRIDIWRNDLEALYFKSSFLDIWVNLCKYSLSQTEHL